MYCNLSAVPLATKQQLKQPPELAAAFTSCTTMLEAGQVIQPVTCVQSINGTNSISHAAPACLPTVDNVMWWSQQSVGYYGAQYCLGSSSKWLKSDHQMLATNIHM